MVSVLSDKGEWGIQLDPNDECKQTVLFAFPEAMISGAKSYIKSTVKIEFGARSDHRSVETLPIVPYVATDSSELVIEETSVRVLAAERTFWEKATILHMIYHYSPEKSVLRMSRHYYDLFSMADSPIYKKALESISLLKDVSEHKVLFFKANWANYEEAKSGSLRLVPRDNQISQLKNDYLQMQQMFFEDPPSFELIIEKLRLIENQVNKIG